MGLLELFLHDKPNRSPTLIKAALAHVQFETIHPFLDGNGRLGRLLITLLLCLEGVLHDPLLYLSLYFKQRRDEYYAHLDDVRRKGTWESWLEFFITGVTETATAAVVTVQQLVSLAQADKKRIQELGRVAGSAFQVHHALQERPIDNAKGIAGRSGLSLPAVNKALSILTEVGMVRELTGRKRNRIFVYAEHFRILNESVELLKT